MKSLEEINKEYVEKTSNILKKFLKLKERLLAVPDFDPVVDANDADMLSRIEKDITHCQEVIQKYGNTKKTD